MTPNLIRQNQLGLSAFYQKDINAVKTSRHPRKPATAGLRLCTEQKAGRLKRHTLERALSGESEWIRRWE